MKRLKVLLGAMLLTATMVGAFAFTSRDYHKPLDVQCFAFTLSTPPNADNVDDASLYSDAITLNCPEDKERLCGICFDTNVYQLVNGKPNFSIPALANAVNTYWNVPTMDGVPIGSGSAAITLHFRSEP